MNKKLTARLSKEFTKLTRIVIGILVAAVVLLVALYFLVYNYLLSVPLNSWIPGLVIALLALLIGGGTIYYAIDSRSKKIIHNTVKAVDADTRQLQAGAKRARSLQSMASVMRATLSFERVVEESLSVCSTALEDLGVPRSALVGAVFLYHGNGLVAVSPRRFPQADEGKRLQGQQGVVADALNNAEVAITESPAKDPELRKLMAFQNCKVVVCIPLRAGFQIFGAMVIGSDTAVQFEDEQIKLFDAVADQAVIALQNAQLYQKLESEKQRIIEADEEARKELARSLHDGPTQTIAAIAMRVNFIRSLMSRDPAQALAELEKVEQMAKQTSKEIRGMLFTLRPLVLETQGLTAAVEALIKKFKETHNVNVRLVGGEYGDLLNDQAQGVVFSIIEEALNNARKYSQANILQCRFWQEDNLFVAQVQDDGVGFDTKEVNADYSSRGSLGMLNMRERADRIDGSLRLESNPGQGTTVTLVVPMDKHGRQVRPASTNKR